MNVIYVLMLKLPKASRVEVGKLGALAFRKGFYAYAGSAVNGLEHRLKRHLSKNKKMHWHIDYLLQSAELQSIFYKNAQKPNECMIASKLKNNFSVVDNFGSSDCKCRSHLFYSASYKALHQQLKMLRMDRWKWSKFRRGIKWCSSNKSV